MPDTLAPLHPNEPTLVVVGQPHTVLTDEGLDLAATADQLGREYAGAFWAQVRRQDASLRRIQPED